MFIKASMKLGIMIMNVVFFIYISVNVMIVPVLLILAVSCHFPSLTRHFRNLTPRCPIDKTTASEPCSVVPVPVKCPPLPRSRRQVRLQYHSSIPIEKYGNEMYPTNFHPFMNPQPSLSEPAIDDQLSHPENFLPYVGQSPSER